MSPHAFSAEEKSLVESTYPGLTYRQQGLWVGELQFDRVHDGHRIQDCYQIEIAAFEGYPERMPLLREVGGRTRSIADKYNIDDLRTLHRNPDNAVGGLAGTACVCVKQEEKHRFPPGSNLVTYIEELAIPYLYGLSYYDEFEKWPWGEYSHGSLGLLEFYQIEPTGHGREDIEELAGYIRADNLWKEYSKQVRKPNPNKQCPCGSKRPFAKCHPDAWRGLLRLCEDIERLGMNPRGIFHQSRT